METMLTGAAPQAAPADLIKDSDQTKFAKDVIEASRTVPVIVDFWAPWCGPCKTLQPMIEKVVKEAKGAVKLVKIDTELTASQNYVLGRFGQITLSAEGRLRKPTNLHPAGSPEALALAADNARRRIILDDGSSRQNPDPIPYIGADQTQRAGDTVSGLTGVLDYTLEKYLKEIEPTGVSFIDWIDSEAYDPKAIRAEFKAGWWGTVLTEKLLKRE
mgnify:CR=1 FL=1